MLERAGMIVGTPQRWGGEKDAVAVSAVTRKGP